MWLIFVPYALWWWFCWCLFEPVMKSKYVLPAVTMVLTLITLLFAWAYVYEPFKAPEPLKADLPVEAVAKACTAPCA